MTRIGTDTTGSHGVGGRKFAWNRAHTIGLVALLAWLLLLAWFSDFFVLDPSVWYDETPEGFTWLVSQLTLWPVALAVANIVLGILATGSLAFPLVSALVGPVVFGLANFLLLPGHGSAVFWYGERWSSIMATQLWRQTGYSLFGALVLAVAYLALAFLAFGLGRFGVRRLFAKPAPGSRRARLLARMKANPLMAGCWIALASICILWYAILPLGAILGIANGDDSYYGGMFFFAIVSQFILPMAWLVLVGIAATSRQWRGSLALAAVAFGLSMLGTSFYSFTSGFTLSAVLEWLTYYTPLYAVPTFGMWLAVRAVKLAANGIRRLRAGER